jgi:hypothetical protein
MFENTNANLILEILRKESSSFIQANNFESAKEVVDALVWIKNIFESIDEQKSDSEVDPEVEKMQQALRDAYPLPAESQEITEAESAPVSQVDSEVDSKDEVKEKIKFPKTTQVETNKRKEWCLNTIKNYPHGISESKMLALYITSQEISHTENELKKTHPTDKEVRGCTLATKYINGLINKDKKVKKNDKGLLIAIS